MKSLQRFCSIYTFLCFSFKKKSLLQKMFEISCYFFVICNWNNCRRKLEKKCFPNFGYWNKFLELTFCLSCEINHIIVIQFYISICFLIICDFGRKHFIRFFYFFLIFFKYKNRYFQRICGSFCWQLLLLLSKIIKIICKYNKKFQIIYYLIS